MAKRNRSGTERSGRAQKRAAKRRPQSPARDDQTKFPPIGTPAPDVALRDQAGNPHRLADYTGRRVVLYFYPKDDTPGCTKEACNFRDALDRFRERDVAVLGVSTDDVASHRRFAEKHDLPFPLLADSERHLCEALGVWREKKLYGRSFMGVVRSTFVLDEQGRIAHIFHPVKPAEHRDQVLAWLDAHPSGPADRPRHYADRLEAAIHERRTAAVVGIDPVLDRLPAELRSADEGDSVAVAAALETFAQAVIEQVAPLVPAIKLNSAFFEAAYEHGVAAYYRLVEFAHERDLLVIGDIKRGDIGSTARQYAAGHLAAPRDAAYARRVPDAVTLHGYLGANCVQPFVEAAAETGRGVYVLVRPSDPGADHVHNYAGKDGGRFYQHMAALVGETGAGEALRGESGWSCVGAVIAGKDRRSTSALRKTLPCTPWLVPGFGAQGGGVKDVEPCFAKRTPLRRGGNAGPRRTGAVVVAARSVIYAFDDERYRPSKRTKWETAVRKAAEDLAASIRELIY